MAKELFRANAGGIVEISNAGECNEACNDLVDFTWLVSNLRLNFSMHYYS